MLQTKLIITLRIKQHEYVTLDTFDLLVTEGCGRNM